MNNLYYEAPSDEIFEEVKKQSLKLWDSYDDTHGYATEKKDRIKDLTNTQDNVMYMVAMFDDSNQRLLANVLSEKARDAIRERMVAGGSPLVYVHF